VTCTPNAPEFILPAFDACGEIQKSIANRRFQVSVSFLLYPVLLIHDVSVYLYISAVFDLWMIRKQFMASTLKYLHFWGCNTVMLSEIGIVDSRLPLCCVFLKHFYSFNQFIFKHTVTYRCYVTSKTGFGLDDRIYCSLYIHTFRDYRRCSIIAILHTFQFTLTYKRTKVLSLH
jgi:hypothetical protein